MAIKEDIVKSVFSGSDIFSKAARKKFGVKDREPKKPGEKTPTKVDTPAPEGISTESVTILKIIAKNTMAMPGISRDMNVLRQNLQKLVSLKGGAKATGADAFFLKEDEREAALEAQKQKISPSPATAGAGAVAPPSGGGLLESIVGMFSGGFMSAIKSIFNPRSLLKVLGKVFLPIAIIGTLFSGIKAGFEKYQETGSFSEAVVSGLGGMLNFVSFGLFGEDTLRSLWDNISSFFEPITNTISGIFTNFKNFFKEMFGGVVDIEDEAPEKAETTKPQMPEMPKGPKSPEEFASGLEKSGVVPQGLMGDMQGVLESGKTGGIQAMIQKAQEMEQKYPSVPPSETTPTQMTSEGIPLDQAQRNFELNKSLTGQASAALGTQLEMPAPPTPAPPVQPATTPTPEMSDADKIKQLEGYIEKNTKRFARRESDAARHVASFKKRYANDPERVKELEDDYASTLKTEKAEMESANAGFQSQIDALRKSGGGTVSPPPPSPAAAAPAGGGGTGGGTVTASAAQSAPAPITAEPPTSGSSLSSASSQVAEAQRMESSADTGSVINSPTNNSTTSSTGKEPSVIASAYDEEFAKLLATT